ncbi:hypothetical protein BDW74DRAFT_181260 [Aspergillus multicolor]|uniref:uncharacterized protein n=1 Tax=Aspergillus multicolor TaxID=41759 RepID=UPI003CCDF454
MDETAILSKRREDAVINASLHPSIPSLPSSTPVQQFISDIPPGFLPLNVCPYIGVPSGGFNPTPDTIGTTPGYMSLSHLSPTRANQEPMQLALPSDKQLIEFCAANPWWSLPTSLPLDLPLQDIATMFPISHDDAFTTSQDNSFKEPHQKALVPSTLGPSFDANGKAATARIVSREKAISCGISELFMYLPAHIHVSRKVVPGCSAAKIILFSILNVGMGLPSPN